MVETELFKQNELRRQLLLATQQGAPAEQIEKLRSQIVSTFDLARRRDPAPPMTAVELAVCIHRGGPLEAIVKTRCKGCGGAMVEFKHRAYSCAVHKRCLPFFNGPWDADHELESKLFHLCQGCDEKRIPVVA